MLSISYSFVVVVLLLQYMIATSKEIHTKDLFYLEHSSFFRSNARAAFSSDKEFIDHQRKFEENVLASSNEHRSHPFILKFKDSCDHTCHSLLQSNFHGEKYSILDQKHGVLSVTASDLRRFRENNPHIVEQFIPISPEVKIDERIRTLHEDSCVGVNAYREKNLRVVLSPLKTEELVEFKDYVVSSQYISTENFERQFREQESDRKLNFILKVSDCSKAHRSALSLAERSEVVWIEENYDVHHHNRWARGVCEVGVGEVEPAGDHNITGAEQIIGVSDTGIDMQHCYFSDDNVATPYNKIDHTHRKVVQYVTTSGDEFDDFEGHGTHVAATAAGYPVDEYGDYLKYIGTASGSKISFFDIGENNGTTEKPLSIPSNINTGMFKIQYASGARVFTNSWGTRDNSYSSTAQDADQFMYENPDAVVFFSAGNSGSTSASSDNTVGAPATFKNGVAVGASLNTRDSWFAYTDGLAASVYDVTSVAGFSSRGPTADQRLKPDILAPGWFVTSARGDYNSTEQRCDLAVLRGTSMAAPAAAGNAVLVRQYFLDGYYPSGSANTNDSFNPSGALLKAMLVHSGQKMNFHVDTSGSGQEIGVAISSSSYPSTVQGYGRMQLNKVLNFAQSTTDTITLFVLGGADSSQSHYVELTNLDSSHSYTFVASPTVDSVRVTFAYTDFCCTRGSSKAMYNILTVSVTDESTSTTFTPYTVSNFIVTNLQVIDIPTPTAGATYRVDISVSGSLVTASQPYALVVSGTLTYLDAVPDVEYRSETTSATYISTGARNYIIAFSFLVAILLGAVYYFRMLTKKKSSIVLDPRNFENLDGDYELDVPDTGMGGRKSILATIRDIRRQSLMKRQETGGTY